MAKKGICGVCLSKDNTVLLLDQQIFDINLGIQNYAITVEILYFNAICGTCFDDIIIQVAEKIKEQRA